MKKDYNEILAARQYDPNREPPRQSVIFVIESKNIGTLQNFITITGMQKSGKTTYMAAMIAAAITRQEIFGMRILLPHDKRKVAYFDTEQGDYDFYQTMMKIKKFCQSDTLPPSFNSYNLREDEPRDILLLIKKYLELNPDCGLLVIDGILDMVDSYNDEAQSKALINFLKAITKTGAQAKDEHIEHTGLLALLTLHKGKTTANTLGHLGSMADRAAQSILVVEKIKERGTFVMKADYLRSADDFTPIEIFYNTKTGDYEQTIYNPEADTKVRKLQLKPEEMEREYHESNVRRIFTIEEYLLYSDLVQNIVEFYSVPKRWAQDCVRHLMKEQLIFKTTDGYSNRQQARLYIQK